MKNAIKHLLPRSVIKAYETECHKETHINRALSILGDNTTYVEIGVRDGSCIHQIKASSKAAIDPAPVDSDHIQSDGTALFQMTSDQFFTTVASTWLDGRKIGVALVDGLHEFEQALRDVLNLEPLMAKHGMVFVHDCNPPTRRHEQDMNGPWNGDVWKVLYYLGKYRPDLKFFTLDCDWGVGIISGFKTNPSARENGEIATVKSLDYSVLEGERESILRLKRPLYSLYHFSPIGGGRKRQ
jgi:hypothetical protein